MLRPIFTNRVAALVLLALFSAVSAEALPILFISNDKFRFATKPGDRPMAQTFYLRNRGDATLKFTVSVAAESPWLQVSPESGSVAAGGSTVVTVSAQSETLPEGDYLGEFTVSDAEPGEPAADAPQTFPVLLQVTSRVVTEPARLDLFLPVGKAATRALYLPIQSRAAASLPDYGTATESGGNWLSVKLRPEKGVILETQIRPLAEGTYRGSVNFEFRGQSVGRVPVSVTYTTRAILALDRDEIFVETATGLPVGFQWIRVSNVGQAFLPVESWSVSAVTETGGDWLEATQGENSYVKVAIHTDALAVGIYKGKIRISSEVAANSPLEVPVELRVLARGRPVLKAGGAVDAAAYCGGPTCYLAPGELATLFGSQLAYATTMAERRPLPTVLAGTRVLVNGKAAELLYADFNQINFRVPELPASSTSRLFFQVERDGQRSNTITVPYTAASPSLFTADQSGSGYGAILHPNTGRLVRPETPAAPGDFVEIYATGLGAIVDARVVEKPTVLFYGPGLVGNVEIEPSYAGPAPGFAGLYQVNVRIPPDIPSGDHMRLELRTPFNLSSNSVEIAIR